MKKNGASRGPFEAMAYLDSPIGRRLQRLEEIMGVNAPNVVTLTFTYGDGPRELIVNASDHQQGSGRPDDWNDLGGGVRVLVLVIHPLGDESVKREVIQELKHQVGRLLKDAEARGETLTPDQLSESLNAPKRIPWKERNQDESAGEDDVQ